MTRPFNPIAPLAILFVLLAGCVGNTSVPAVPTPTDVAVADTPAASPTVVLSPLPLPTDQPLTPAPTEAPTAAPTPMLPWLPSGSPLPPVLGPIPLPTNPPPTPAPPPTSTPQPPDEGITGLVPVATGNSRPTRIAIPALNIDLPIIKGNPLYPKCNVAQYMTNFVFPGQPGTTYLYAHARTGMFWNLLVQSQINNGAGMIGMLVKVWTADTKLHLYRINIVKRHATDFSLATDLKPGQHRLIMQTSEGPHGTIPKLQVAAKPIGVFASTAAQALPTPHPVTCG